MRNSLFRREAKDIAPRRRRVSSKLIKLCLMLANHIAFLRPSQSIQEALAMCRPSITLSPIHLSTPIYHLPLNQAGSDLGSDSLSDRTR